ncbi:MAG: heme exporter protein CcmB [Bacteroidia bacterium]|nr:heme exporter protein CcmB [Bacteroidia bacterium]
MAYTLARQTMSMLRMEILGDIKRPTVLIAAGLQVFSLGLLCFLSNPTLGAKTWNSLFWLTVIFSTLQAVSKTFISIGRSRWIYLNQLASPSAIIIAKILYAWCIMIFLCLLDMGVFAFFMSNPVQHIGTYLGFVLLVSGGLGTVFTMISAIASKTAQASFLVPVLSLPIILPLLLIGVQGSVKCLNPVLVPSVDRDLMLLGAMNFLVLVLAGVLFNPLWRE